MDVEARVVRTRAPYVLARALAATVVVVVGALSAHTWAGGPVVSLRTEGLDIGEVTMLAVGAGTYRGEVVVPRPGEWEVEVSIRLSRFDNPVTTVRLRVSR